MIIIQKYNGGSSQISSFNCRPVQRTNQVKQDVINRSKDIYLIYFRCDMSGRVAYAYSNGVIDTNPIITDYGAKRSNYQYSNVEIVQVPTIAEENVYESMVCFEPAGSWYYIIYEVHFPETTSVLYDGLYWGMMQAGYAPIDNLGNYDEWLGTGPDPSTCKGVLGLAVEEGKLLVTQEPNAITYTQHIQTNDNYIYTE
jgi:hypothetical protein